MADTVQLQYASPELVKILFDVRSGGLVHTRDKDVSFLPGQPIIWSSNAADLAGSVGAGSDGRVGDLVDSIRRRVWCCQLRHRVLSDAGIEWLIQQSHTSAQAGFETGREGGPGLREGAAR